MPPSASAIAALPSSQHEHAVRLAYGIAPVDLGALPLDEQLAAQQRYSGELTTSQFAAELGLPPAQALTLLEEALVLLEQGV